MQVVLTFTGIEEIVRKCAGPPMLHAAPIKAAMVKSVNSVETTAKGFTPVRTGNLRRSITQRIDSSPMPLWGEVGLLGKGEGNADRYGVYVHEGTRKMRARPFLRNAITQLSAAITSNFAAAARAIEAAWGK